VDEYALILGETGDGDGPGAGFDVTKMTVDGPLEPSRTRGRAVPGVTTARTGG